jgi:hypothetical protein
MLVEEKSKITQNVFFTYIYTPSVIPTVVVIYP